MGYSPNLALQGGTPAYVLPLLVFNHLMQASRAGSPAVSSPDSQYTLYLVVVDVKINCKRCSTHSLTLNGSNSVLLHLQLWRESSPPLTVEGLHDHVLDLQDRFLAGLGAARHPHLNADNLLPPEVRMPC